MSQCHVPYVHEWRLPDWHLPVAIGGFILFWVIVTEWIVYREKRKAWAREKFLRELR